MNSVIDRLSWAIKDKKPIPPFEEKLDIADAYEIQKKVSQKIYSSELLKFQIKGLKFHTVMTKPIIKHLFLMKSIILLKYPVVENILLNYQMERKFG